MDNHMQRLTELVALAVECRDKKRAVKAKYEAEVAVWTERFDKITSFLEDFLAKNVSLEDKASVSTPAGTFYRSKSYSASLADPQAFMDYVVANQKFELLDRRANVTAVRRFVTEQKGLPPGCNLNTKSTIGVRRPGQKEDDNE